MSADVMNAPSDAPAPEPAAAGAPSETAPADNAPAPLARLGSWLRALPRFPVALFLYTRIALMTGSLMGLQLIPTLWFHPEGRQRYLQDWPLLDGLCRWDCGWMVRIVQEGYATPEHAKIFPLFPVLGGLLERATGMHHLLAFLLISNVASLVSYVLIYRLFTALADEAAARWSLILLAAYPFAFFQAAAQPESLMLALTAASLYAAHLGKHWSGAVWLGFAVLARHVSIFYGPSLFFAQVQERGLRPRRLLWHPAFYSLAVPFLFVAGFAVYLGRAVGDPLAFWNARTVGWGDLVWYGARQIFQHIAYRDRPEFYYYMVIGLLPVVGAIALLWVPRWRWLAGAALTSLFVFYSGGVVGLGRYSASVWPAFLPLGAWLARSPAVQGPLIVALALLQGIFFFMFSHQYRIF